MSTFGEKIREVRKKAGMSQVELAMKTGLSKSTICNYESGKRTNITIPTIYSLMQALHIPFEVIIKDCPDIADKLAIEESPGILATDAKTVDLLLQKQENKENRLLNGFRLLNDSGQSEAIKRVQELGEIPRYRKEEM